MRNYMTDKTFTAKLDTKLASLTVGNQYDTGKHSALCASIRNRGRTLDVDIHAALIVALDRAANHGDANSAAMVLNAMPNSARTATAASWLNAFGVLTVSKSAKTKQYIGKMVKGEDRLTPDMAKAMATPFWTAKETVSVSAFDDLAACKTLQNFLKRAKSDKANLSPAMAELVTQVSVGLMKAAPAKFDELAD